MKNWIIGLLLFLPFFVNAQINRVVYDDIKSQNILFGECDIEGFRLDEFNTWFSETYNSYKVKESYFNSDFSVKFDSVYVFLGTWCSDSRREVPAFFKIVDSKHFDGVSIRYFALDSFKETDVCDSRLFSIEYVPTFIFYHNGAEVFRIIETPESSLEEDIVKYLEAIQK
jgi:thiol-disulfide isomerase/thioredoxin